LKSARKENAASHIYVKSKIIKCIEADCRPGICRSGRDKGRCWPKGTKLQLCNMNKPRNIMYSMAIRVNKNIIYIEKVFRFQELSLKRTTM
jgi:hypothetical protein